MLARWCARHRTLVVVLWVLLAAGLLVGARVVDGDTADDVTVPGSDSAAANALLSTEDSFGQVRSEMVLTAGHGERVDSPALRVAVRDTVDAVSAVSGIGAAPARVEPSPDGTAVRFTVPLGPGVTADKKLGQEVLDATGPARDAGMDVALGGALGRQLSALDSRTSEIIGIVAALLVLLLAFGSAVAALLPVVSAVVVVVGGLAGLDMLKSAVSIPDVAPTLAAMIGLGVGVDYTLFLVNRQRRLLAAGLSTSDAVTRTARSAGAAVVFAGATVIVAISGLMLTGVDFVSWLGWSSALLVAGAVLSAVTLAPAVFAMAGTRLSRGRPAAATDEDLDRSAWGGFASWSARRPVTVAVASAIVLLGLGRSASTRSAPGSVAGACCRAPGSTKDSSTGSARTSTTGPCAGSATSSSWPATRRIVTSAPRHEPIALHLGKALMALLPVTARSRWSLGRRLVGCLAPRHGRSAACTPRAVDRKGSQPR